MPHPSKKMLIPGPAYADPEYRIRMEASFKPESLPVSKEKDQILDTAGIHFFV